MYVVTVTNPPRKLFVKAADEIDAYKRVMEALEALEAPKEIEDGQ